MVPLDDINWENTVPDPVTRDIKIPYICLECAHLEKVRYRVPRFKDDVLRTTMSSINGTIKVNTWDLIGPIKLNTPDSTSPFYDTIVGGIRYGLEQFEDLELVENVDYTEFSFDLTLLGWLAVLHSTY
jgi:hypothetical protein